MLIIKDVKTLTPKGVGRAIALGYFDGVHIGHRAVISAAAAYAGENMLEKAVFTFSLPANQNLKGNLLLQPEIKHKCLENLGLQYCFEPEFKDINGVSAEDFFSNILLQSYNAKALFCGHDFAFGANRRGNVDLLGKLCAQNGVFLGIVPTTFYGGSEISSSRIRRALSSGNIEKVNAMLGDEYSVKLAVRSAEYGQGIALVTQYFPQNLQTPALGQYLTKSFVGGAWRDSVTTVKQGSAKSNVCCETRVGFIGKDFAQEELLVKFCLKLKEENQR